MLLPSAWDFPGIGWETFYPTTAKEWPDGTSNQATEYYNTL